MRMAGGAWAGAVCWPRVFAGFACLGILVFQNMSWDGVALIYLGLPGTGNTRKFRCTGNGGGSVFAIFWIPMKVLLVND